MRREWRWAIVIAAAFAMGATCAEGYARLTAPYYDTVAQLIAELHPLWRIMSVTVVEDEAHHGAYLRFSGEVRRQRSDVMPAAQVIGRVQVGEAIQTPLVFWTLLLLWPAASVRQRLRYLALGVPVFLCLEAVTTAVQLVHSMAEASAILGGDKDPVTLWERWSRFLEAGGQFAVDAGAALLTIAVVGSTRSGRTQVPGALPA